MTRHPEGDMEVNVTFNTNKEYADELKKRMRKLGISQNQLAAEMKPERSPTQVSRWFTSNPARRVEPELKTVLEIEATIERIAKRQARKASTGSTAMNE
jgi:ribosome-binding protein aMBF1 (putative translation factor)